MDKNSYSELLAFFLFVIFIITFIFLGVKIIFFLDFQDASLKFLVLATVILSIIVSALYLKKTHSQHGAWSSQAIKQISKEDSGHEVKDIEAHENPVVTLRHIEDLKTEIENLKALQQGLFSSMINGMILHDKLKIIDVNRAFSEMTAYSELELRQMSLEKLIIPHETLMGNGSSNMPRLFYRSMCFSKSGNKFPVEIQMSEFRCRNQYIQISILRDLREKRDIEEQLQSERARRTQAIFDGQEMERRRLAKEIHDGLGQSLIAIRLLIEGKIAGSQTVDDQALTKIRTLIDRTIDDARLMSNNLMPSVLHEFGFVTALRQLCDHVRQTTKIKVKFDVECSKFVLSSLQTVYLFRIAQEAINNIIKHSGATEMIVDVSQTESFLNFSISDNGKGIPAEKIVQVDGNGLFNIRERIQLLKGEFDLISNFENGTEIKIKIPNWRIVSHE